MTRSPRHPSAVAACLLFGLGMTTPALATDGERKGFFIGFGGGFVNTDVSVDPDTQYSYTQGSDFGYAAKLTIGGGINNHFAVSGTFVETLVDIDGNNHHTYLLGVTGTYWLNAGRPSLYGSLTLGRQAMRADIFENRFEYDNSESATGNAARLAIGYEFPNRMQIEGAYTGVESDGYVRDGADVSVRQLQIIGGWHWY